MDRQVVLNTVIAHARNQKVRALGPVPNLNAVTTCEYRTATGLKCFVGCLIPDELYNEKIEGRGIRSDEIIPIMEKLGYGASDDMDFLVDLQIVHDNNEPDVWENEFKRLAKKHSLVYSEV